MEAYTRHHRDTNQDNSNTLKSVKTKGEQNKNYGNQAENDDAAKVLTRPVQRRCIQEKEPDI